MKKTSTRRTRWSVRRTAPHLLALCGMFLLSLLHLRPIWRLSEGVIGGYEDTWMNVFHLWWMRQAWLMRADPYFTPYLNFPDGADMYWHTLAPAKNAWGAVLLPFMNPIVAYNIVVLGTFVAGGYVSWLLFRYVCRRAGCAEIVAALAGFVGALVFNFSPYHLSHAQAHLNLISIEGIPAFILAYYWYRDTRKPAALVLAGAASLYTILCDYYYFLYLFLFLGADAIVHRLRRGPLFSREAITDSGMRAAVVAGVVAAAAASPILYLLLSHAEPLLSPYHGVDDYTTDLLGFFLPHRTSMWSVSTLRSLALSLPGNYEENGFFLGWLTLLLAGFALRKRVRGAAGFAAIGLFFLLVSFGPVFRIHGRTSISLATIAVITAVVGWIVSLLRNGELTRRTRDLVLACAIIALVDMAAPFGVFSAQIPLPYVILKNVIPFYEYGGMPVRYILLTFLALGALTALASGYLLRRAGGMRVATFLALALIPTLEYLSVPFGLVPASPRPEAAFAQIRAEPPDIGVLSDGTVSAQWDVTLHGHAVSVARLSRIPVRQAERHRGLLYDVFEKASVPPSITPEQIEELKREVRRLRFKYYVSHYRHTDVEKVLASMGAQPLAMQRDLQVYRLY